MGGAITLISLGSMTIQKNAPVSIRSNGLQGCGGCMLSLQPNLNLTVLSIVDASGGAMGGEVDICAGTDGIPASSTPLVRRKPSCIGTSANHRSGKITGRRNSPALPGSMLR